jgi:ubiquinone/menaquinone biosynthesis C-methylase UbiE
MQNADWESLKARQKATWEAGDFGQIAKYNEVSVEEFVGRLPLRSGMRVLDVACGTGTVAIIAARRGCEVIGVDIARNLIVQARERAATEGLSIEFEEGDAESLPFSNGRFDAVISRYGAMFAPRPELVAGELYRVTKPGGFAAMANWTPEGFIGKMFEIFKAHLPPPPTAIPSTMLWGQESTVRERLKAFSEVKLTRRMAIQRFPFSPAKTVDFFKQFYGPTLRAFEALNADQQEALRRDLVALQAGHNRSGSADITETESEYLEVIAIH